MQHCAVLSVHGARFGQLSIEMLGVGTDTLVFNSLIGRRKPHDIYDWFPWSSERFAKSQRFVYRKRVVLWCCFALRAPKEAKLQAELGRVKLHSTVVFFKSGLPGDYFTCCRRLHRVESTFEPFVSPTTWPYFYPVTCVGPRPPIDWVVGCRTSNSKNPKCAGWSMGRGCSVRQRATLFSFPVSVRLRD
jgi:hypothetical protein